MCLSAPVSFAAAAFLIPSGGFTLATTLKRDRRYAMLAALPILLGLQQLMEGFIWLTGSGVEPGGARVYSLVYMFFAWVVWPIWLPVSAYFLEPHRRRSAFLMFALAGAALGSVQFIPYLVHEGWLQVTLLPRAIRYSDTELLDAVIGRPMTYLAYVALLIVPLLLSTDRTARLFGGLGALVLAITVSFFQWAYISVFCFGGAVASLYLIWAIYRKPAAMRATC